MECLSIDCKDCPNQHKNRHKLCDETGHPVGCEFDGKSMEAEATTWSEFRNRGKHIVEQILASEEINRSKRTGL